MSVSKLSAALAPFHNENNLALINLNFDFALCKFDAPQEFQGLGASLSANRRAAAESGTPHRIARKLGALFEAVLPSTPELISAYGKRVSEISQVKAVDPKGGARAGAFVEQAGIDGTAIWAAATSGPSAIPVLMLACMLARMWKGSEATSVWAEIVAHRQEEIRNTCDGTKASDYAALQAMQQEFPRSQLADWDASIRAWLRTADEAKMLDQRQLILIINNINLPVSNNMSVYKSVLNTWRIGMVSMNNLVKGIPQRVQDGALLLGLSAWHLYPDMVVHGAATKEIRYKDPLVETGGILTIGLQNDDAHDEGVYWSLPLAHLRYYGDPVQSVRSISQDTSRVSMEQLAQVALGAIFGNWGEPVSEILQMATWFSEIAEFLGRVANNKAKGQNQVPEARKVARAFLEELGWLKLLMTASKSLIATSGIERETSMRLVAFGMRRCNKFLAEEVKDQPQPFFGLSNPSVLLPMLKDREEQIQALRNAAQKLNVDKKNLIIRYKCFNVDGKFFWYEYASATTCVDLGDDRGNSENPAPSLRHKRWVAMRRVDGETLEPRRAPVCDCVDECVAPGGVNIEFCSCAMDGGGCGKECPCYKSRGRCFTGERLQIRISVDSPPGGEVVQKRCPLNNSLQLRQEKAERRRLEVPNEACSVQTLSEFCGNIGNFNRSSYHPDLTDRGVQSNLDMFRSTWEAPHPTNGWLNIAIKDAPWNVNGNGALTIVPVQFLFGDENAAIFKQISEEHQPVSIIKFRSQDLIDIFSRDAVYVPTLFDRLRSIIYEDTEKSYVDSLIALSAAADVYKLLPNATIDLGITSRPLYKSAWTYQQEDDSLTTENAISSNLDRPRTFSCLAHFESGSLDVNPSSLKDVFAMSSGNSIFVAAPLLCDPFDTPLEHEVRRVIGNIGRAGIAMLISPQQTKIRKSDPGAWNVVNHAPYSGKREDCFPNTSLHLSFTPYTQPINIEDHGLQDIEVFFIESIVSVHDREKWVADIDILKTLSEPLFSRFEGSAECSHIVNAYSYCGLVCFDNWEELLDKENISGVFRAQDNWLARLAAAAISVRQNYTTFVLPNRVCWQCVLSLQDQDGVTYIC